MAAAAFASHNVEFLDETIRAPRIRDEWNINDGSNGANEPEDAPKPSLQRMGTSADCSTAQSQSVLDQNGTKPKKKGSFYDDIPTVLSTKRFIERIEMENRMERSTIKILNFLWLLIMLLWCMGNYDPLDQISETHRNLRERLNTEDAASVTTHEDIMEYIKTFLEHCYMMAPALVDANTMDSIDFARCTDPEVNDVCKLHYWAPHRKLDHNRDQVLQDVVSPLNTRPSRQECPDGPGGSACMNWEDHLEPNLDKMTYGLTPEDPIVFESRLDYPIPSVVLLTPVIWQTRAKRKPCSGIGDRYNGDVLGASACDIGTVCPIKPTQFRAAVPTKRTGREQSYYLAYSEDVFNCVDRQDLDDVFYDKSWDPWATYDDLVKGRRTEATMFNGLPVFYKFVSSVAYLMRPVNNSLSVQESLTSTTCDPDNREGSDPLFSPNHPMWKEGKHGGIYDACSLRKAWSNKFLAREERANSFLTLETTALTICAVVISPQSANYRDVITLLRITWNIDQGGTITAQVELQSTSQTNTSWFVGVAFVLLSSSCELIGGMQTMWQNRKSKSSSKRQKVRREAFFQGGLDVGISVAAQVFIILNVVFELSNPVDEELIRSFDVNDQLHYFMFMEGLVKTSTRMQQLKQIGFIVVCCMFWRLVIHFSLHPRMAVLVDTLSNMADNIFHFAVYFAMINLIFTFLAWWMFAPYDSIRYGTLGRTGYTQFRMFVGDFYFHDDVPSFSLCVYLVLYSLVVFVILVNFLLAIVVDAYAQVENKIEHIITVQYVTTDLLDLATNRWIHFKNKFPPTGDVLHAMEGEEIATLNACSLYGLMESTNKPDSKRFTDEKHAQEYLDIYVKKLPVLRYKSREAVVVELAEKNPIIDADLIDLIGTDQGQQEEKFAETLKAEEVFQKLSSAIDELQTHHTAAIQTANTLPSTTLLKLEEKVGQMSLQLNAIMKALEADRGNRGLHQEGTQSPDESIRL